MACDLAEGKLPLPGGRLHETTHWVVEHCVGPLGLGTLIVKPRRHVTSVSDLTDDEASELGPLLRTASLVAGELVPAEQVYNCLRQILVDLETHQAALGVNGITVSRANSAAYCIAACTSSRLRW